MNTYGKVLAKFTLEDHIILEVLNSGNGVSPTSIERTGFREEDK